MTYHWITWFWRRSPIASCSRPLLLYRSSRGAWDFCSPKFGVLSAKMSGYFVHGGTQYPYGQAQQTSQTNLSDLSYQQSQTNQLYQSATYPSAQTSRTTLQATKPAATAYYNTGYGTQALSQGYSAQRSTAQTYSTSLDSDRSTTSYGQSSLGSSYGRSGYSNGSFGSTTLGASKNEQKYSNPTISGTSYSSYKSTFGGSSGLGSSSSFFSSQPAQQSSFSTSYPSTTSYNKPLSEEASSSQYSYEKALYVAANQYYLSKKAEQTGRGGRGGARGRGGRGRGAAGRGGSSYGQTMGPKMIKATEVKAYLYAWCGQRRLKPEYSIEPLGMPPKMKFKCTLHITGLDHVAQVTAASKKDSQSKAAWEFCEHLVRTGYMKQAELPPKPEDPTPKNTPKPSTPAGTQPEIADSVEESGGWSLENCRQRLNQFTQRWRIPAEFKHETHGPEHARTFVAELDIRVKWLDKEFVAKERGNNKKQATAVCALAMVRQLFKEGLIEKQGDPIKHPRRPGIASKDANGEEKKKVEQSSSGIKRKAEEAVSSEDVNEYGNWTLEEGRQRLHMFCQATGQAFDIKYTPDQNIPPKLFTASVAIAVTIDGDKKMLEKSHTCQGKKLAAQHCALEMVKELYQMSFIEPNLGQQTKKKNVRPRGQMDVPPLPLLEGPPFGGFMPPPSLFPPSFGPFGGIPQRKTPYDDAVIMEKHKRIYPSETELTLIQKTVRTVEGALKQVSDLLARPQETDAVAGEGKAKVKLEPGEPETKSEEKRILQGVMRVGALAKGLLLKGDLSADLVLLCVEIPTAPLLTRISELLMKHFEESGEKYLVDPRVGDCVITITSPVETDQEKGENIRCNVRVSLTSPAMRTLPESASGPADMLDRDGCLKSLAELRHAKWFQACANGIPSCVVLLRIFRDMRRRISTWVPLCEWAIELLIEKSLRTSFGQLSAGEGLRRVLSCISSGILLEDGPGIYDPCEKGPTDVIGGMSLQEREDITESAHHALRMLVYRQTHKILGIEPMVKRTSSEGDGIKMEDSL